MAFGQCEPAQAALFFADFLPRLRVFQFYGRWPDVQEQPATTDVAPLPLLEELTWELSNPPTTIAPREFLGAQPTFVLASYALISQCWLGPVDAPVSFLACDLHIPTAFDVDPLDPTDVARVLRAAPQLKKFHLAHYVDGDASWLAPTAPTHPAFEGLVHPRLREFGLAVAEADDGTSEAAPPDADWVAHLQRHHFPRVGCWRRSVFRHFTSLCFAGGWYHFGGWGKRSQPRRRLTSATWVQPVGPPQNGPSHLCADPVVARAACMSIQKQISRARR
jgi:hypothetical protein